MPESTDDLAHWLSAAESTTQRELMSAYGYHLVSCVFFRNRPPWKLAWRTCLDHFLLFPLSGILRVELRDEQYELKPGHFLMLPEGVWHRLEAGDAQRPLHQISLHAHIHDRWGRPLLARCGATRGRLAHGKRDFDALRLLVHLCGQDREAAASFAEGFLKQLLSLQHRLGTPFAPMAREPEGDRRVLHALRRMEREHGDPGLNVEAIAREIGITSARFRQLFRTGLGVGPKEYLSRLRIREARLLLSQTTRSVKEIAAACGFGSDHYFHLAFRRACGSTPTQYRRQHHLEV